MRHSLSNRFAQLQSKNEKALVCFVTAGDPPIDQLPAILECLVEASTDIIEIGIPFSDPIADGPTIQASSQRALDRNTTPTQILETLAKINLPIPVVLMGYYNSILRRGVKEFAEQANLAGVSGTIISDIIPEEAADWVQASKAAELDNIFLAAPTSTPSRLDRVCELSSGFVYAVSRTGVTGARSEATQSAQALVEALKARTHVPVCVGFGISNPDQVREVCQYADGAVVGSWLVDLLNTTWDNGKGKSQIIEKVRALKNATLSA